VLTARYSDRPVHEVYRELRAGAESGWDFSSRWQSDPTKLSTIRTTSIVPVDLNSLLYKLERQIGRLHDTKSEQTAAGECHRRAETRRAAMDKYFWNGTAGAFIDYDRQR